MVAKLVQKIAVKVVVALLEYLSKKTTNTLDDEIVGVVKEALS